MKRRKRRDRDELDHGDEPIRWPEIDADARDRPLRVRRRINGVDGAPYTFDPRWHRPGERLPPVES